MSAYIPAKAVFALCAIGLAATAANARHAPKSLSELKPDQRVCVMQPPITGSILPTKECKTVAQWRGEGVDLSKLIDGKK